MQVSHTYHEVAAKIGLSIYDDNSYFKILHSCIINDIKFDHLTKICPYSKSELQLLVEKFRNVAEIACAVGRSIHFSSMVWFDIIRWQISAPHLFRCEKCKRAEHFKHPIPLELDHINGERKNNHASNIRVLCPNCHSQTDSFAGRNGAYEFDDSVFSEVIHDSKSINAVLKKLGYKSYTQNSINRILCRIKNMGLDTSHWPNYSNRGIPGKKPWNHTNVEKYLKCPSKIGSTSLRKRLFKEGLKDELCEICGIIDWEDGKLSFTLDHINGLNSDNRIENIRILCYICHWRLPTSRSKLRNVIGMGIFPNTIGGIVRG